MSTKINKADIHEGADKMKAGIDEVADKLADEAEMLASKAEMFDERLRDIGRRFLESTKGLTEEAAKQARLHPLAVFGVAFAAGIVLARALRRG